MTCPKCDREYQSERCPFCGTLIQLDKPESRLSIAPRSVGICPDCGTQQAGTVYRIPGSVAAFLKSKCTDTFVPDRHRCVRRSSATG